MRQLQLIAIRGLVSKEVKRVFRIWLQTFVSATITMVLYLMIFGHVMGQQIRLIQGYPYIHFILPGLIMMQIVTAAYSNAASSVFSQRFNRSIEEVFVSPMYPSSIILSFCIGSVVRAFALAFILTLIGLVFTDVHMAHFGLLLLTVLLSSVFLGLAGTLNGLFVRNFDDLSFLTSFVLTPLVYLGGVFYDIARLPGVWHHMSLYNPVVYLVDLFRHAMLDYPMPHLVLSYVVLTISCVILFILNVIYFRRGQGVKS